MVLKRFGKKNLDSFYCLKISWNVQLSLYVQLDWCIWTLCTFFLISLLLILTGKLFFLFCPHFRVCPSNNPWVKLGTAMLVKCQQEHKEKVGNKILKICRSLYGTKHMLSPEVSQTYLVFWIAKVNLLLEEKRSTIAGFHLIKDRTVLNYFSWTENTVIVGAALFCLHCFMLLCNPHSFAQDLGSTHTPHPKECCLPWSNCSCGQPVTI